MTSERPQCPHHKKCGGCQLQNLSYPQQLEHKQKTVIRLLGGFCHVEPIIGMKYPYNYRNKVQAAFGTDRSGRIISGVYQSNSHRIVPVDRCMIEDRTADQIIVTIRQMLRSFKISAYNEATGRGFLRHVLVKRGFKTGQIMVVLVTAVPAFPSKRNFLRVLLEQHPEITTVVQNINTADTNLILGPRQTVLYGSGYIEDELCACRFRISPKSFYQINPIQTQVLYNKAMDFARISPRDRVIDAYCGIGTIGLVAARRGAGEVIGVELNPDAVKDARNNARLNGQKNITFYTGDAGQFMEAMAQEGRRCDVLFMDPPRAGSSETFLSAALTLAPGRIVYISCNPETLARDLKFLTASGAYAVKAIQPVDMFPFTEHVETVVLLSHKDPDSHIHVKVEFGEGKGKVPLDKIAERAEKYKPKEKVTYKKIKEYIEDKFGFKVHTAYIAEVKRAYGLPMYDAPNAVEELKQPRKHPTEEKVKAISDALVHFGLIDKQQATTP